MKLKFYGEFLHCEKCGSAYPIVDRVPRMYRGAEKDFPMSDAPISLTTKKLPANKDERKVQTSFSLNYSPTREIDRRRPF